MLSNTLHTEPVFLSKKDNGLDVNCFTRTVTDDKGNKIHLTAKEFDLLLFLSSHKGQVFTKEQIYEKVWGYDNAPDARNLSSFIRKLRLKIEPHPDNPRYIITVWGVGYKFSGEEKP
ncbi:winged helix-turn-helix domain-containing protein [Enterococcus faecium]|uniref:winged helix-turn-helix domain-containing protein n=1 Tax=Enterococcus faecium TaxID=1352 RepID=UPI003137AC06